MPAKAGIQPLCGTLIRSDLDSRLRGNAFFVPGGDDIMSEWDCAFPPAARLGRWCVIPAKAGTRERVFRPRRG